MQLLDDASDADLSDAEEAAGAAQLGAQVAADGSGSAAAAYGAGAPAAETGEEAEADEEPSGGEAQEAEEASATADVVGEAGRSTAAALDAATGTQPSLPGSVLSAASPAKDSAMLDAEAPAACAVAGLVADLL